MALMPTRTLDLEAKIFMADNCSPLRNSNPGRIAARADEPLQDSAALILQMQRLCEDPLEMKIGGGGGAGEPGSTWLKRWVDVVDVQAGGHMVVEYVRGLPRQEKFWGRSPRELPWCSSASASSVDLQEQCQPQLL